MRAVSQKSLFWGFIGLVLVIFPNVGLLGFTGLPSFYENQRESYTQHSAHSWDDLLPTVVDSNDCTSRQIVEEERDFVPVLRCQFYHPGIVTYSLPLFADIDGDGQTEIVATLDHSPDGLVIIDPNTCEAQQIIAVGGDINIKDGGPVLGDVDADGYVDIYLEVNTTIQRWEFNPSSNQVELVWETEPWVATAERSHLDIWDLNQDGIAEIIPNIGQMVNGLTGEVYPGALPMLHGQGKGTFAFTADADPGEAPAGQGNVELIYGTYMYRYDFNNLHWVQVKRVPGLEWGFHANVSLADMDLDGDVDAVISSWDHTGKALIWDLQTNELLGGGIFNYPGSWGSRINISDMDFDPYPEMVMTSRYRIFAIDDIVTTGGFGNLIWVDETSDESGHTQITSFDFDANGTYEAVYRDETRVRIFSGMGTGEPTQGYPSGPRVLLDSGDEDLCRSFTGLEYPTIGDIDNDNEAEIIATCQQYVSIYESGSLPWGNATKVWNTQAFNVTNVNQDGTIPAVVTENYTIYNNFLAQVNPAPGPDTLVAGIPDAFIHFRELANSCEGTINVTVEICNQGINALPEGTPISFYWNNPTSGVADLVHTQQLPEALDAGNCTTMISEPIAANSGSVNLFAVVNDDGSQALPYILADQLDGGSFPFTGIEECDYTNNIADSTFQVDFTIDVMREVAVCEGEIYELNGELYTAPGTYEYTSEAPDGCDSTVVLVLTIAPSVEEEINQTICAGETFAFGGNTYNSTGTYTHQFQAMNGCDSIVKLQLEVLPAIEHVVQAAICQGESYAFAGMNLTEAGTYTTNLTSHTGCDSTITLSLVVNDPVIEERRVSICGGESYEFGGQTYQTTGVYEHQFTAFNGCDSTVVLRLEVGPIYEETITETICAASTYEFNGVVYAEAGTYTHTLTSAGGCDSVVILALEVLEEYHTILDQEICSGEQFRVGSNAFTTSGNYLEVLTSVNGCDSLVELNLNVLPHAESSLTQTICAGDIFQYGGVSYTQAGVYTNYFTSANGCDSVAHLKLIIAEPVEITEEYTICEGEEILLAGEYRHKGGVYTEDLLTQRGCDSTVHHILNVLPQTDIWGEDAYVCPGDEVQLEVHGAKEYRWEPAIGLSCTNCAKPTAFPNQTTTYTIYAVGCMGEEVETQITVEVGPRPEVDAGPDITIRPGESVDLKASSPENLFEVEWDSQLGGICDRCPEVTVYPDRELHYFASVKNKEGCVATDTMKVNMRLECVGDDMLIPNLITPNGDGANDVFRIEASTSFEMRWLRIYDRWGSLVFQTKDLNEHWDGTFRGKAVNPGVFVYYVEVSCPNGEPYQKFGNITVIR